MQTPFGTPNDAARFINLPFLKKFSPEVWGRSRYSYNIFILIVLFWFLVGCVASAWLRLTTAVPLSYIKFYSSFETLVTTTIPSFSNTKSHLLSIGRPDLWQTFYVCVFTQLVIVVLMCLTLALAYYRYTSGGFSQNDKARLAHNLSEIGPNDDQAIRGMRSFASFTLACVFIAVLVMLFGKDIPPSLSSLALDGAVRRAINRFISITNIIPIFLMFRNFLLMIAKVMQALKAQE